MQYGMNANLLRKWMTKAAGLNAMGTPDSAAIKAHIVEERSMDW